MGNGSPVPAKHSHSGCAALRRRFSDHLDSTALVTNSSLNLISEIRYNPWGGVRAAIGTPVAGNAFTYTGQRQEADLGLMFYQARWYDSYLNQFLTPDSIIPDPYNPIDYDRYTYARNNPINYTDPTGHTIQDPGDYCTWWDRITPLWIEQNIENSYEQDLMLMHYMIDHPDYSAYADQELISAGYDLTASDAYYAIYKFLGEAYKTSIFTTLSMNPLKYVLDLLKGTGPVLAAGFVLGGGPGDYLQQLNERMGVNYPANNMRSQGAFVNYADQFYRRMQKDTTLVLTTDEADAMVTLSRTYGIEPRIDTGHLDDTWNMPHLHFGDGQANPHVRVPNGYTLP